MSSKSSFPFNGFVFYRGPSMLDGAPIVAILTGLQKGSTNVKTGHVLQTWILRSDVSPLEAIHSGQDSSICGDCKHRGTIENGRNKRRSCYVNIFQAPRSVFRSFQRGVYPAVTLEHAAALVAGQTVRLGSYGDPAAVPFYVWESLLQHVAAKAGYSHQWRNFPEFAAYCMASVDNVAEFAQARLLGWRTFRVRHNGEELQEREISCPASKEAGFRTTCSDCRACGGLSAKAKVSISILAHGSAALVNAFTNRALTA